jgi:hypothetical protein
VGFRQSNRLGDGPPQWNSSADHGERLRVAFDDNFSARLNTFQDTGKVPYREKARTASRVKEVDDPGRKAQRRRDSGTFARAKRMGSGRGIDFQARDVRGSGTFCPRQPRNPDQTSTPEFWIRLQAEYDLKKAAQSKKGMARVGQIVPLKADARF